MRLITFRVLSNVERIWDCELESYETFKKLAASILHREETLRRIAFLRGKQQVSFFTILFDILHAIYLIFIICLRIGYGG